MPQNPPQNAMPRAITHVYRLARQNFAHREYFFANLERIANVHEAHFITVRAPFPNPIAAFSADL
jgi:hypothetical protein